MQVVYIKKRTFTNILLTSLLVVVSIIYSRTFREGTIKVFLNNDNSMPIYSVEVPDNRAALTFDTAWGDQYVQDIIDVLKRYDIKATFFITGSWAVKYPDLVKDIAVNGHEIGNHSSTHIKMTELPPKKMQMEIKDAQNKINKITGKNTNLFRAPYGEYNDALINAVKSANLIPIQWNVDSLDWRGISAEQIKNRVLKKTNSGSIILFHSNVKDTVSALPEIIESLRKDEYKFVTVSELLLKENYYIDNTGRQRSLR